jgi:hypothetical protein
MNYYLKIHRLLIYYIFYDAMKQNNNNKNAQKYD